MAQIRSLCEVCASTFKNGAQTVLLNQQPISCFCANVAWEKKIKVQEKYIFALK